MPRLRFWTSLHVSFLAGLLATFTPAVAQQEKAPTSEEEEAPSEDSVLEGHSYHGHAFNEGPRQKAYLMKNTGEISFPVSTDNALAQQFFDQGIGQLHGFWYFEAERSFRQVAALDPNCAMAYWGMAMANFENNQERAAAFAREAFIRKETATRREELFIDPVARFFEQDFELTPEEKGEDPEEEEDSGDSDKPKSEESNTEEPKIEAKDKDGQDKKAASEEESASKEETASKKEPKDSSKTEEKDPSAEKKDDKAASKKKKKPDEKKRRQQLIRDFEEILYEFPDDIEAKAFLVNQLWLNQRHGLSISSRQANEALLQDVLEVSPLHPAHHYRIHLWDQKENAKRVTDSAADIGHSGPGIAHMWHMGGHIWARLNRHEDAAWQQEASARVDHAHMMRDRVLPDQIHNFAHNNEWLTRSLRHVGRVHESLDLARNMVELPRHPSFNTLEKFGGSASYGTRRLLETLELFEQWDKLLELCEDKVLHPADTPWSRGSLAYARAKAHLALGRGEELEEELTVLKDMIREQKLERMDAMEDAEEKGLEEGEKETEILELMGKAIKSPTRQLRTMQGWLAGLEAGQDFPNFESEEDASEKIEKMKKAGFRLPHLARLCLEHDLPEQAEELAREANKDLEGIAYPLANLAWVLSELGKKEEALKAFEELRTFSSRFDMDMPVFQRLASLAQENDLPQDWRLEAEPRDDIGVRPNLEELGPFRWSPSPAEAWSLADGFGGQHSLEDYRGKPLLLIFFLGFGCVHCVEQLDAIRPRTGDFEKEGIRIVAIGTDTVEQLRSSQSNDSDEDRRAMPILADPGLESFRSYRCYDDFESMALHGTFLIDSRGDVRWQDISYEPFMDMDFLLEESIRLLSLPQAVASNESGSESTTKNLAKSEVR